MDKSLLVLKYYNCMHIAGSLLSWIGAVGLTGLKINTAIRLHRNEFIQQYTTVSPLVINLHHLIRGTHVSEQQTES